METSKRVEFNDTHRMNALSRWQSRSALTRPYGSDDRAKLDFRSDGIIFDFYPGLIRGRLVLSDRPVSLALSQKATRSLTWVDRYYRRHCKLFIAYVDEGGPLTTRSHRELTDNPY